MNEINDLNDMTDPPMPARRAASPLEPMASQDPAETMPGTGGPGEMGRKGGAVYASPQWRRSAEPFDTQRLFEKQQSSIWVPILIALAVVLIMLFAASRYFTPEPLPALGWLVSF
jgi:hypothetical protein